MNVLIKLYYLGYSEGIVSFETNYFTKRDFTRIVNLVLQIEVLKTIGSKIG